MYCIQCGQHLPETAKFCSKCGAATVQNIQSGSETSSESVVANQSSAKRRTEDEVGTPKGKYDKKAPPRISPLSIFLAVVGLILIIVLLNPWHEAKVPPSDFHPTTGNPNAVAPAFNVQVVRIADKFMCPCGQCNDVLSECDCTLPNGAQEVKSFILTGLKQGKTEAQVIQATALKYGHLRDQNSENSTGKSL